MEIHHGPIGPRALSAQRLGAPNDRGHSFERALVEEDSQVSIVRRGEIDAAVAVENRDREGGPEQRKNLSTGPNPSSAQ